MCDDIHASRNVSIERKMITTSCSDYRRRTRDLAGEGEFKPTTVLQFYYAYQLCRRTAKYQSNGHHHSEL